MRGVTTFALVVFVLAIGGLFALGPSGTQRTQTSFLSVIAPFFKAGSDLEHKIGAVRQGLKTLQELEAENKQLAVSNKELQAINQTLRDLETENNRLRRAITRAGTSWKAARSRYCIARRSRLFSVSRSRSVWLMAWSSLLLTASCLFSASSS